MMAGQIKPDAALRNVSPLRHLWAYIAASVLVAVVLHVLVDAPDKHATCADGRVWCATNGLDVAITRAVVWESGAKGAAMLSHLLNFVACPAVALGGFCGHRPAAHIKEDVMIWVGTQLFSVAATGVAKNGFQRQRPCFHFGKYNETEFHAGGVLSSQQFLSFYSGDTSMAWSFVAAGVALSSARGWSRSRPTIAAAKVGGVLAVAGSLLRIVAYAHWMTDVLAGIFFGCLIGAGLPSMLFRAGDAAPQTVAAKCFPWLELIGASESSGNEQLMTASNNLNSAHESSSEDSLQDGGGETQGIIIP